MHKRRRGKRCGGRAHVSVRGMWWNARGLEDDLELVQDYMVEKKIDYACFCETKVFGKDLCAGDEAWAWHAGPEVLPKLGCPTWG